MDINKSISVDFSNTNFAFGDFQSRYRKLCEEVSQESRKKILTSVKKVNSFIFEYKHYVEHTTLRDKFVSDLKQLSNEVLEDKEYQSLIIKQGDMSPTDGVKFNVKYYNYLIRLLEIVGLFGDELSKTLMPNIGDRQKLIRYANNNSFFEHFTRYKSECSESIANFDLWKFKKTFSFSLGFYYAYYLFIDEKSRFICENLLSDVISIYLNESVLKLCVRKKSDVGTENLTFLKKLELKLHGGFNGVFSRMNYSYSNYNIMPKVEKKLLIDRTAI